MAIAVEPSRNGATSAPPPASVPPVPFEHEELVARRGTRSDALVVVAIHSTALGPALGGVRIWPYVSDEDAERDALRLAKGMTLKAAAAGLDLGGGKGVIRVPEGGFADAEHRRAALLDFGELVESLGGRYVTAEDVGVTPEDIATIATVTSHLTGLPPERGGSGDPSPVTAMGVEAALRACASERFGSRDLEGLRVMILGLGHVGGRLAQRLADAGCGLVVSDVVASKRAMAEALGAAWVEPADAIGTECDALAPCALGGAVSDDTIRQLRCEIVCGAANNQLTRPELAEELAARGILYAPDFIVNAGGLINVYRELRGYSAERARELALGIEGTMGRVLGAARERGITPLAAAEELAAERLGRRGTLRHVSAEVYAR